MSRYGNACDYEGFCENYFKKKILIMSINKTYEIPFI